MTTVELKGHNDKLWDWPLQGQDGIVRVIEDDKHFEVGLDATYFVAKDISVKVINDLIQINFEHEVRSDKFGTITRNISRCYHLPDGVDPKTIKSNLSNNVLFITGQKR